MNQIFKIAYEPPFIYDRLIYSDEGEKVKTKATSFCPFQPLKRRSLKALVTTDTELSAMAAPASIGLRAGPPKI